MKLIFIFNTQNFRVMFYFNSEKYDFWPIYDCISKYYPIGIKNDGYNMYSEYPGIKALKALIRDNVYDETNGTWSQFNNEIENLAARPVESTTYGEAPCYSSLINLEKKTKGEVTRLKTLHFYVSFLGPFYTIIGQDKNEIEIDSTPYITTNCLIVSPEHEYADSFIKVSQQIEDRFKNFRFVPYQICTQTIEGLVVNYPGEHSNTIFNAIFNDQVAFEARTIGNDYHKADDWIRDGYVDDGGSWVAYPPHYTIY